MAFNRRQLLGTCGAAAATLVAPKLLAPSLAEPGKYPTKPVRLIVPFAPGGPNDLLARIIAQGLSAALGSQFYVENLGGAGGNVGTGQASRAAPDGYTILAVAPSYAANPALFGTGPYDPEKSFEAVTLAATAPTILTVHPSLPAHSVSELIDTVRASPGKYSYASPGTGTPPHLLDELFRISKKLDMVHVPYKSGGQAIGSTLAGHTPISFGALPPAVQHVKEGSLRALAITSTARADALPGVPTIGEAGYPDIAADIWTAVLVPAETPKPIVETLQHEIAKLVASPEAKQRMAPLGYRPVANSPDECTRYIAAEGRRWAKVVHEAGIKVE